MTLRPYQNRMLRRAEKAWRAGKKRLLFVAPTGAGKGTMAAWLLRKVARSGGRALFVVHLRDIAEDIAKRVAALGVRVGMILPGHKPEPSARVQVATIQSLLGRERLGKFDLVIADEAHHYRAEEWQRVLARVGKGRLAGFTATPQRADGKGLGAIFEELINEVSYRELRDRDDIVPTHAYVPKRMLDGREIAMEPAEAYAKYARGRSAFVYASSVSRAHEVLADLKRLRVPAAVVTDATPYKSRAEAVQALRDGEIMVIVNYGTMTEGVDVPRVSAVVLEQQCRHMGGFLQRAGRAMRRHPGKKDAIVLDLCGASYRHGVPWETEVTHHLDGDPIRLPSGVVRLRREPMPKSTGHDVLGDGRLVSGVPLVKADAAWLAGNGGPRVVDWSAVDWGKNNMAIGRELGLKHGTVRLARMRLGIPHTRTLRRLPEDRWDKVDWSQTNKAIAAGVGCSAATVQKQRKSRGLPNGTPEHHLAIRELLAGADWTKPNSEIASELGVDMATVARERSRVGAPGYRQSQRDRFRDVDWSMSDYEIAQSCGCSDSLVNLRRREMNRIRRDRGLPPLLPKINPFVAAWEKRRSGAAKARWATSGARHVAE